MRVNRGCYLTCLECYSYLTPMVSLYINKGKMAESTLFIKNELRVVDSLFAIIKEKGTSHGFHYNFNE